MRAPAPPALAPIVVATIASAAVVALPLLSGPARAESRAVVVKEMPAMYSFTVDSIAGEPVDLASYKGKVLLVVNTASRCGYTPQYEGLQALHETYAEKGLAVLGFPSNDFGGQEPGTNEEVQEFCKVRFGVTFDLFAKGPVSGPDQQPLYEWLTSQDVGDDAGEVKWNFEKFLVGRDGQVIARYRSKVAPDSPDLRQAIESALGRN